MWLKAKFKELRGDSRLLHMYEQQLLTNRFSWQICFYVTDYDQRH